MGACVTCGGRTAVDSEVCEICLLVRVDAAKEGEERTVLRVEMMWTVSQAKDFIDGMNERFNTGNVHRSDQVDQFCMDMMRRLKQLLGMP